MIHLVTAATADYPWAEAYWESVCKYFSTKGPGERTQDGFQRYWLMTSAECGVRSAESKDKYVVRVPLNRAKCMQDGSFIDHIIPLSREDIVIFTDADMVMQRSFTEVELHSLRHMDTDEVLVGYNRGPAIPETGSDRRWANRPSNGKAPDTLLDEAELLAFHAGHNLDYAVFDKLLPGWQELPVWNTGVMIARVDTWRRLRDLVSALLPVCEAMFDHYAALQFCISYAIGRWLKARYLTRTIHAHGHFGMPEDCVWIRGEVYHQENGMPVKSVFRHCLNLTPEKGPKPGVPTEHAEHADENRNAG